MHVPAGPKVLYSRDLGRYGVGNREIRIACCTGSPTALLFYADCSRNSGRGERPTREAEAAHHHACFRKVGINDFNLPHSYAVSPRP